jgi:poly-beta-1,6-N-acetyl-D-glucosamine synthase
MLIITIIISAIYFSLITLFIKGWSQIPTFHFSADRPTKTGISIIVACRNEAKNLPILLEALKNQSLKSFQLILIDDNSTDSTFEIMKHAEKDFGNILVLKSENYGKKQALKLGIENAINDLIVTTDADCSPTPHWLKTIIQFQEQTKSDLIIGPVAIQPAHTLFEKMQQLEFLSLVSSGAGAAGIGQAIMCNGANLAFQKQTWLDNFKNLQTKSITGDDVFLLHALKKQNANINFLKSKDAIVSTKACTTTQSFFKQRQRWASKAPLYTDFATIVVAIIVFAVALLQLILLFASFVKSGFILYLAILTISKIVVDSFFLLQTSTFFGQKITAKTFFTLAVAYPFYIVYSAISGIFKGLSDIRTGLFH